MSQEASSSRTLQSARRFKRAGRSGEPDPSFAPSKEYLKKIAGIAMAERLGRAGREMTEADHQELAAERRHIDLQSDTESK